MTLDLGAISQSTQGEAGEFGWTLFYEEMATALRKFQNNRGELVTDIHQFAKTARALSVLNDKFADGSEGPLTDICPFTTLALFNRSTTTSNRRDIAGGLASILGVITPVPTEFNGVPLVNNQNTWFFSYSRKREPGHIDKLWDLFGAALDYADESTTTHRVVFESKFDEVMQLKGLTWKITLGLFWIRPWFYPTLDKRVRELLSKKNITVCAADGSTACTGGEYLEAQELLTSMFSQSESAFHSFPGLSALAFSGEDKTGGKKPDGIPIPKYDASSIVDDGCFIARERLDTMLDRIRDKKNLILQGPPGTGKTWLAKRLAYALIGEQDRDRVRALQFHPNLSYEDFVRGWRPASDGRLSLVDGPFLEIVQEATYDSERDYVCVIEEINRGHPAQIFGEMLTLLEADKRRPEEALELSYRANPDERIHIPSNLHVIGTMNIADRSLAMVDFALRRRFAFVDLKPEINDKWIAWVRSFHPEMKEATLREIQSRVQALNNILAIDPTLGTQYQIGHSFVTPHRELNVGSGLQWFLQVVETEIVPLLEEYWFDAPDKVRLQRDQLVAPLP